MRVYIAGALSSKEKENRNPSQVVVDYISNMHKMFKVAGNVRRMGHFPYVPGLDFALGLVDGRFDEEMYRGVGMAFLEVCDAVLVISMSYGVSLEITRAQELGIPVVYSLMELAQLTP